MTYTRMAICEVLSDEHVPEIVSKMQEHARTLPYVIGHSILVEQGGRLVILITEWRNLQDCFLYHSGRAYRQLIADTQVMLAGSVVVKFFQNKTERSSV